MANNIFKGKRTFQQRIFISFFLAFLFFAGSVLTYQYKREKEFKINQLEARLDNIAQIADAYIKNYAIYRSGNYERMDSLVSFLPDKNIRITIINNDGKVNYDSFVEDYSQMENHLMRAEIQKALYSGTGGNIRHSETTGQDFFYYARNFDRYFVRCAAVYDLEIKNFLKTGKLFIIFMLAIFLITGTLLFLVTNQLGRFVNKLRDFAVRAQRQEKIDPSVEFADSELGEIQNQIIQIYDNLKNAKEELTTEKERLFNHLQALNEGIGFFTPSKEKILTNSQFIQYINVISDKSSISAEKFFKIPEFKKIISMVDSILKSDEPILHKNLPYFEETIEKNEKYFRIKAIVFVDRSFEVLISDITKPEKRRLLKQQLTSNIAHELKTPLTSINGYLETIHTNKDLPGKKASYFAQKALLQSARLNNLLNDVSLLNNIELGGNFFEFEKVNILDLVSEVVENMESRLKNNHSNIKIKLDASVSIIGNRSLLFSIFQNLIENSLNYGGKGINIIVKHYLEDEKYHYFSYADSGIGIPEEHIPRIFERFYRADEGRSREKGGTGLGLAIVKNAVQLHQGEITVRNGNEKGLEFFFSLAKY